MLRNYFNNEKHKLHLFKVHTHSYINKCVCYANSMTSLKMKWPEKQVVTNINSKELNDQEQYWGWGLQYNKPERKRKSFYFRQQREKYFKTNSYWFLKVKGGGWKIKISRRNQKIINIIETLKSFLCYIYDYHHNVSANPFFKLLQSGGEINEQFLLSVRVFFFSLEITLEESWMNLSKCWDSNNKHTNKRFEYPNNVR